MADNYLFGQINNTDPRSIKDQYSTPNGAQGVAFTMPGVGSTLANGLTGSPGWGILLGEGAPSTNYASVPNGWWYCDVTNAKLYIKTGMPGSGTDGTWTKEANA